MDNRNKILHGTSFCASLDVLLMTELTGISGNLWECFAAPLGQDSTPWFFSHFSVYHWLFHLFSLLSSPHTVFTCNRRYLLLSGPEQPGTPLRNSAHCRDGKCWPTQIMEILKIFFPCPFYTRFPTNSLGSWVSHQELADVWLLFLCFWKLHWNRPYKSDAPFLSQSNRGSSTKLRPRAEPTSA